MGKDIKGVGVKPGNKLSKAYQVLVFLLGFCISGKILFFIMELTIFFGAFGSNWGLEYQTCLDFEWLKVVWMLNGSDFE